MNKLTRRHTVVLSFLSDNYGWVSPVRLPDGNNRLGGASAKTLRELRSAALVEYDKDPNHGYRITDLGRAALSEQKGERG